MEIIGYFLICSGISLGIFLYVFGDTSIKFHSCMDKYLGESK